MTAIVLAILGSAVLSACISGIFYYIANKDKREEKDTYGLRIASLTKGLQMLLLGELERQANKYTDKMSITSEERKWFLETYEAYKNLGGNGYADDMCRVVLRLTVEDK